MPPILLTIDVEDWFQVENFKSCIPYSSWPERELRVERNVHRLLDLFDAHALTRNPKPETRNPIKATFFILGWIAKKLPHLVREIQNRGHEVASHGFNHELCNTTPQKDLKEDLSKSKTLLEDLTGAPVHGFRAPSFSITPDVLKTIQDCGYVYDSSYNSFAWHGRYGKMNIQNNGHPGIAVKVPTIEQSKIQNPIEDPALSGESKIFYELPISNLEIRMLRSKSHNPKPVSLTPEPRPLNPVLPLGGGAYFRLIPFSWFKRGVQAILNQKGAYLFYMHPWELDPEQPKVKAASISHKMRHYGNLKNTETKLSRFLTTFGHCRFITCKEYLSLLAQQNQWDNRLGSRTARRSGNEHQESLI